MELGKYMGKNMHGDERCGADAEAWTFGACRKLTYVRPRERTVQTCEKRDCE